jgi:hypothetical protein
MYEVLFCVFKYSGYWLVIKITVSISCSLCKYKLNTVMFPVLLFSLFFPVYFDLEWRIFMVGTMSLVSYGWFMQILCIIRFGTTSCRVSSSIASNSVVNMIIVLRLFH